MSSTFMRGLMFLEVIDHHGPLTVTELARRSGIDISTVSRMVAACVADGWIVKADRGVMLGPRCALLGRSGYGSALVRQAEPLVHTIAGITGLMTQAYGLVGSSVLILASADGREGQSLLGVAVPGQLTVTAAGRAIASQLTPTRLDVLLPPEPFPDGSEYIALVSSLVPGSEHGRPSGNGYPARPNHIPKTRKELNRQLTEIRRSGAAFDRGDLHPAIACIAVPWPHPTLPATLACLGTQADITTNETMHLRCLNAATRPAAAPTDVITAAAASV